MVRYKIGVEKMEEEKNGQGAVRRDEDEVMR